jgi:hypothetical protein
VIDLLALIGLYTVLKNGLKVYLFMMADRSGNSGRYKHWRDEYEG